MQNLALFMIGFLSDLRRLQHPQRSLRRAQRMISMKISVLEEYLMYALRAKAKSTVHTMTSHEVVISIRLGCYPFGTEAWFLIKFQGGRNQAAPLPEQAEVLSSPLCVPHQQEHAAPWPCARTRHVLHERRLNQSSNQFLNCAFNLGYTETD